MKVLNKVLLIFMLMLGFLIGSIPAAASAQDILPDPPGEMVDVGGYRLHINCMGEGSPTVILETGSGVLSLSWYPLQEQIAGFTRVCIYDRAGYGWSDPGPKPRTALQMASELETLLTNAHIETPVILVGHSLGGMIVRYVAATQPQLVAGVLLVDASPPGMDAVVSAEIPEYERLLRAQMTNYDRIIGLVRSGQFTATMARTSLPPGLPEDYVETYVQLMLQPKMFEAMYSEYVAFEYSLDQTEAAGESGRDTLDCPGQSQPTGGPGLGAPCLGPLARFSAGAEQHLDPQPLRSGG